MLVANLPYNIATPLVADLLDGVPAIDRMLVMVQREVGERLAAGPGDDAYGAVSVKVAYWAKAEVVGRVPATVFVPRPRVESVAGGHPSPARPAVDPAVVGAGGRSSTWSGPASASAARCCAGSLAGRVPAEAWAARRCRPESRAEELDVAAWGRLAAAVAVSGDVTAEVTAGEPGRLPLPQ